MYCKNLLKRSKQSKIVFYCKNSKSYIISLQTCQNCSNFILKAYKPIKKVSKKKITVSEETYQKVYKRDNGCCRLADITCNGGLELHHIRYRSEAKDLINEPTNCILLCIYHHQLVHSNKKKYKPILLDLVKRK